MFVFKCVLIGTPTLLVLESEAEFAASTGGDTVTERDRTLQVLKEVVGAKALKPTNQKKATFK